MLVFISVICVVDSGRLTCNKIADSVTIRRLLEAGHFHISRGRSSLSCFFTLRAIHILIFSTAFQSVSHADLDLYGTQNLNFIFNLKCLSQLREEENTIREPSWKKRLPEFRQT